MMIQSEDDVRAWVRAASGGKARWVEAALGSTPGLPDCWVPRGPEQLHLELKAGKIRKGVLCFTVRPEQRREIPTMVADRVRVGFAIGIKGSSTVVISRPIPNVLRGKLCLNSPLLSDEWVYVDTELGSDDFWRGINLIFFSEVI